jgi:hypothetical protein
MAKLSRKTVTNTIIGGFIHVILPKIGGGWSSFRALLTNFILSKETYDPNHINSDAFDYENFINTPNLSLKADLVNGKVPSGELPGFVDEIIELLTLAGSNPSGIEGNKYYNTSTKKILIYHSGNWGGSTDPELGIIYLELDTELIYRWSGSTLVEISPTPDIGSLIHNAVSKTTPINADELGFWDSVSGLFRKLSFSNLKAVLKTYFDTIYNAIGMYGDMFLDTEQSVTALKTFDKDKIAMQGTDTGINILSVENESENDYTNILPAKNGTFAMTNDLVQSDYDETNDTKLPFIKHKPNLSLKADLVAGKVPLSQLPSTTQNIITTDTTLTGDGTEENPLSVVSSGSSDWSTIGTGGDYAEPADAITAGKTRLKLLSNVATTKTTTCTGSMIIDTNGFTLTFTGQIFTLSSGTRLFGSFIGDLLITNNSTFLSGIILTGILTLDTDVENCRILDNDISGGLVDNSGNTTNLIRGNF